MEYGKIFLRLLSRRLEENGEGFAPCGTRMLVEKTDGAAKAVAETLYRDLKPLEMARLVNLLPVSLRDKKEILPRAMKLVRDGDHAERVIGSVREFFKEENVLIAEGFLRFRLPLLLEDWALAVDRAGEEQILRDEYRTLAARLNPVKGEGEASMVLYGDGKIVLGFENGSRVEASSGDAKEIIALLSELDPGSLFVYDLTGGRDPGLLSVIRRIFGNRACFFIKRER
ncbi:MAG: hypothetical protein J5854_01245 [Clostridia bacterium]|nr:hypothetical protein [Clostridia bacterium]